MRACAIAAIAVWAAGSAAASAADVSGGGPVWGSGPYAYSPRIEPLIVYDYQPGVIVRSYWWSPWQNRHYFPKTGKRPKVGRLERVTARKSSPPQDFYRSWWASSVFAPELPPPAIQPYMQPYAVDRPPSLAQPK
ncbi:MAG TPA: hypothetical protein VFL53_05455 [Pseudolabrys sp.]|nr:hypothetical protein [Pseudolabrys sp.]